MSLRAFVGRRRYQKLGLQAAKNFLQACLSGPADEDAAADDDDDDDDDDENNNDAIFLAAILIH